MSKAQSEEYVEVEGKIVAVLPSTMFKVELAKARIVYRLRNAQVQKNAPKRSYGPRRR